MSRDCKRWFNGDIKVVIYQTDGADITTQTQKIKLRHPRTKVQCNIPLACKVRKAIHNKKREDNMMMLDLNSDQKPDEGQIDSKQHDADAGASEQGPDNNFQSFLGRQPNKNQGKQPTTSEKAELLA